MRLHDNTGLNEALKNADRVVPCFIFDPRQIESHPYQSKPGLQFLLQSLDDLQHELHAEGTELAFLHGNPEEAISDLVSCFKFDAVFINRDYTPFSRNRDAGIERLCRSLGIDFHYLSDALLTEPEQVFKADQTPYQVFTAFYNNACKITVPPPQPLASGQLIKSPDQVERYDYQKLRNASDRPPLAGGRQQALALLERLSELAHYDDIRDYPAISGTSQLSPHLKFGTCSVREVFDAVKARLGSFHPLIRQLYWRDFFTHIGYHFPHIFGHAFHRKYDELVWDNEHDRFRAWAAGETGFPIVDAGMRELNATGFMHNRVRMIAASFLVKDLHISWRWGERYFAQRLVDYDPCVNNGNWQWAASTGCDAQPYFRIFNPWRQQQKFDRDCVYIYRWIPELREYPPALIHQWDKKYCRCGYPQPIVEHRVEAERAKSAYRLDKQTPDNHK